MVNGNGNILAGFVGAFLFSIIGGLLYFICYQIGFIHGAIGLITFILAHFGYGLFAKAKKDTSIIRMIAAFIATIAMIYLAEYISLSFEVFQVFKDYGITIFDAIRATPEFIAEPEIKDAVVEDLAFAYFFSVIGAISFIVKAKKAKKA